MYRPSRLREAVERLVFVAAAVVLFVMIPFDTQAQTETETVVETIVMTGTKRKEARQNTHGKHAAAAPTDAATMPTAAP